MRMKKRWKKNAMLISFVIMMMFLAACNDKTDTKENVEKNAELQTIQIFSAKGRIEEWDEQTGKNMVNMTYPYLSLYTNGAKQYPKLQETLIELSEKKKKANLENFESMKETAYEIYTESPESLPVPYQIYKDASIRRADSQVVSILFCSMMYGGGVHGHYFYWGENYDSQTGELLTLSDVVTDKTLLADMVQEQLDKFYSDTAFFDYMDLEKLIQEEKEISWTIDYNGLTVYFSPYVIAASVTIPQIVTLSPEEYPELIKEEYLCGVSSYCMELEKYTPFYSDITGDGIADAIQCNIWDYTESGDVTICINEEVAYSEEFAKYDSKITLVHLENNLYVLCVELEKENHTYETIFYKLDKNIEKIGSVDTSVHQTKFQTGELAKTYCITTNPSEIYVNDIRLDKFLGEMCK